MTARFARFYLTRPQLNLGVIQHLGAMLRSELRIAYAEISSLLMPRLMGRRFHVTCRDRVPAIEAAGTIYHNLDRDLPTAYGSSSNSFFRNRACVSVFDYSIASAEQVDESLRKCTPYQAGRKCDWQLAFYFLRPEAELRSWKEWKETESWREMVVPFVEAGHEGDIPLSTIEELLEVWIDYQPGPLEVAIQQSRAKEA
jgi:hypothetical protein